MTQTQLSDSISLFIPGIVFFCLFAGMIVFFVIQYQRRRARQQTLTMRLGYKKEQEILKAIIHSQESERNRIAVDLHDAVAAPIAGIQVNIGRYLTLLEPSEEKAGIQENLQYLSQCVDHIREICYDLYPRRVQEEGILKTMERFLGLINDAGVIDCTLSILVKEEDFSPDMDHKLNVLRIWQELLTNVRKHSACSKMSVQMEKMHGVIHIHIRHNGSGFNNVQAESKIVKGRGLGLQSIANRMHLLKGEIEYVASEEGSEIKIRFPAGS